MKESAMKTTGIISRSRLFLDFATGFLDRLDIGSVRTWPSLEAALSDWRSHGGAVSVLIIDLQDDGVGLELPIRRLRRDHPDCRVIVLAAKPDLDLLALIFSAGADGVLSADSGCDALVHALGLVMAGGKVFPSELAQMIGALAERDRAIGANCPDLVPFEPRERAVAIRIADGLPNKVIAGDLGVSEAVVKSVVKAILRKLDLSNRTQLAIWVHNTSGMAAGALHPGSRATQ